MLVRQHDYDSRLLLTVLRVHESSSRRISAVRDHRTELPRAWQFRRMRLDQQLGKVLFLINVNYPRIRCNKAHNDRSVSIHRIKSALHISHCCRAGVSSSTIDLRYRICRNNVICSQSVSSQHVHFHRNPDLSARTLLVYVRRRYRDEPANQSRVRWSRRNNRKRVPCVRQRYLWGQ